MLGPIDHDKTPPGPVSLVSVTPVHGGFDIIYDLPDDEDLLYVQAVFTLVGGREADNKASCFTNRMKIEGFGDTAVHEVKLYTVDRSGNLSEPVSFSARPLEPPVWLIARSMKIIADWGGAKFSWANPTNAPVAVMLMAPDSLGEMTVYHVVYTSVDSVSYSLRGFDTIPTPFRALIRDRWDNLSDTIRPATPDFTVTPWFEARLDKTKFRLVELDNDTKWDAWEGKPEYLWDDNFNTFGHTQGDHPFPQIITIDLGVKVILSRFNVHQRSPVHYWFEYSHGNPKRYDVYGSLTIPDQSGYLEDWIKLRETCVSWKPSGLPVGQRTDEDMVHFAEGDEYAFDKLIPIRYFRFSVLETWDGSGFVDPAELTFWGNVLEVYN
jgi:hypothetical protein